jgi:cytochrome c oxidase cbb3-type subunit III
MNKIKPILYLFLFTIALLGVHSTGFAQEVVSNAAAGEAASGNWLVNNAQEVLVFAIMAVELIVLLVIGVLFFVIKFLAIEIVKQRQAAIAYQQANGIAVKDEAEDEAEEEELESSESFLNRVMKNLTDAVPVERETEVMTDHDYDGIVELDNNLPPWWVAMFYVTIAFGIVYILHFHVLGTGELQDEEYKTEMAVAQAEIEAYRATMENSVDETNVTAVDDPARLASGKTIFEANCAACHAADGGGGVGPNLTDEYWIHGGDIKSVFVTIKNGVPSKGMIAWKSQLSPGQIQEVSSYLLTLVGTTPANPKEPQGDKE